MRRSRFRFLRWWLARRLGSIQASGSAKLQRYLVAGDDSFSPGAVNSHS